MAAPWDTQVGIWVWDLSILDWKKLSIEDLNQIFNFSGGNYTVRYAYNGTDLEYIGYAEPGTASSSSKWKIIKNTYSSGQITKHEFANGDPSFAYSWDSRAGYSYS